MTDPHAPFLAAICARPDDDLPRLLYAGWLDETATRAEKCERCGGYGQFFQGSMAQIRKCPDCHGTGEVSSGRAERSEFIRVQVELARAPAHLYDECRDGSCEPSCPKCTAYYNAQPDGALRRRERALWAKLSIFDFLPHGLGNWVITCDEDCAHLNVAPAGVVRRGFVESITCSWSDFRTHSDAIRKATPLRRVRLTTEPVGVTVIAQEGSGTWKIASFPGLEFELPQRAWDIGPITWDERRLSEVMPQLRGPIP